MNDKEKRQHTLTLCKSIGVTPKHRDPTDEEFALTEQWQKFRTNAYREEAIQFLKGNCK